MTDIDKDKLAKVIDACIDASVDLSHVEIKIKGLRNEIEEISTKLFFHYKEDKEWHGDCKKEKPCGSVELDPH